MDHRQFNNLLSELEDLTEAQAEKVIDLLKQYGDGDEVIKPIEQKLSGDPKYPHCGTTHIRRHGKNMVYNAIVVPTAGALLTL